MFEDKMATYYVVMVEQASGIENSSIKPKVENTLDRLPNVIIVVKVKSIEQDRIQWTRCCKLGWLHPPTQHTDVVQNAG